MVLENMNIVLNVCLHGFVVLLFYMIAQVKHCKYENKSGSISNKGLPLRNKSAFLWF